MTWLLGSFGSEGKSEVRTHTAGTLSDLAFGSALAGAFFGDQQP